MAGLEQPSLINHDASVLDLAFAMDCTGSMSSYILTAQNNIKNIVETIIETEKSDVRLALVEYRDHPPQEVTFITRTHDFTSSVQDMKRWLDNCSARGGGDRPEAVADALHDVLRLCWRPDATKICVMISDAPPHGLGDAGDSFPNGCPNDLDPITIARDMAKKGITLYTVGCEPSITPYKEFITALAYLTGGQYVPLGGAKALTQVIIGGAQEEISLERWMADVNAEVEQEMQEAGNQELDTDAVTHKVWNKLRERGARGKQLKKNNHAISTASKDAQKWATYSSISDVRKEFSETLGTVNVMGGRGGMRGRGGVKRKKSGDRCRSRSSVMSLESTSPEVFTADDTEIQLGQAARMVQKSMMRYKAEKK